VIQQTLNQRGSSLDEPLLNNGGQKMKQLIVFIGLFLIFIFILLQWTANETSHMKRNALLNIVEHHTQQARKSGYFTPEIKENLISDIEDKLYIPRSEIRVTLTETPKYRTDIFNPNELIHYKVQVPIKNIIAMAPFFGLGEDENMYWYTAEGDVSSEKLNTP
jgi:hypothetical protein